MVNFNWRSRRCWLGSVLVAAVAGAVLALLVLRPWAPPLDGFPTATVAANGIECAAIGRGILERNGTAVDAAIATLFCEGVTCAQSMGLGGGFLATVYDAGTGRVVALNARERAPRAAHEDMFVNASSTVGGLAVAVPGELRGYGALHRRFGRLPWAELVAPTADLCRRGHRVSAYMARVLGTYSANIKAEPSMREVYVNEATGEVWEEGDLIRLPQLADTLDLIAAEGPEAMHNGSLTAQLVRDIQGFGGVISVDDLRDFQAEWQDPIVVPVSEEYTLYTSPLPGSGAVLAFILNMLRGWVDVEQAPRDSSLYWHRVVETFKYAYARRTGLGDPNRADLGQRIRELEYNMSLPGWAEAFRLQVDDSRTFQDWQHYGAAFDPADDHGTAHIVVVAPDGSVVSATSTINFIWGSQRRSRSTGIILNNEMDDFAIPNVESVYGMPPSPANMLAPGVAPLSSMVPAIVLGRDGVAKLAVGAAGGTKITTQVALVTRNLVVDDSPLEDAVQRPRLHHQLLPMRVEHEADFNQGILAELQQRGHVTTELGPTAGFAAVVAAARSADGRLHAQTDRRRVGSVDGY